jgi:hypothetical protein
MISKRLDKFSLSRDPHRTDQFQDRFLSFSLDH